VSVKDWVLQYGPEISRQKNPTAKSIDTAVEKEQISKWWSYYHTKSCILEERCQCFEGIYCLYIQGKSALRHSSNIKMEAAGSFRTFVTFYQTVRCQTPETAIFRFTVVKTTNIMPNDSWYERNYPLCICFYKSRQRISVSTFGTFTVAFSSKIVRQMSFVSR
jgi:hypothetical protein